MSTTLSACVVSPLHSSMSTVWGAGGGLERVGGDLRGYRTCYNGQALGTFSPREATMATAQSLSAEALEPVGSYAEIHNLPPAGLPACLSHPGLPVETSCQAKHPLMKNKYNAVSLATSQAAKTPGIQTCNSCTSQAPVSDNRRCHCSGLNMYIVSI